MKETMKKKVNVFGKIGKVASTIIIDLMIVGAVLLLICSILFAAVPHDSVKIDVSSNTQVRVNTDYVGVNDNSQISVKLGGSDVVIGTFGDSEVKTISENEKVVSINDGTKTNRFDLLDGMKVMILIIIKFVADIVALCFFRNLMKGFMVCETPFCDDIVEKMRKFAIALIPTAIVSAIMSSAVASLTNGLLSVGSSFGMTTVFFIVTVFIFTVIFKYGTELQKENDETV